MGLLGAIEAGGTKFVWLLLMRILTLSIGQHFQH